ncbi:Tn5252, orf 9 protein [Streptococcus pneumoniae]|nr:Tn5252, orf 9 protein [Streptococcus pneumoniae]
MVYRYRTNLKKVFLTDSELHQLNERIAKSNCQNFSVYARKVFCLIPICHLSRLTLILMNS